MTERARIAARLGALALLTSGCYTLQPVVSAEPAPQTRVALVINDAGRVALGGRMGPEIRQVQGRLLSRDANEYQLAVTGVDLLAGGFQRWQDERVTIRSEHVSALLERRFSKGKTIAFGLVAVGAGWLIVSQGLAPSFLDPDKDPPIDTTATRRGRMPNRPGIPPFVRSLNPPRSR
ncbi:MAG TPA: hypothetical protein VFO55_14385 [Gemmatimonadaceae bacterium]|nr:hypothetical protein [Gemmatimonadaceae bacterium]